MEEIHRMRVIIDQILKNVGSFCKLFQNIEFTDQKLADNNKANKISSSLDVIDDSTRAIEAYIKNEFPDDRGAKYLYIYGVFQALYIQSDAIKNLYKGFNQEYTMPDCIGTVRDIRNSSIGHPTTSNRRKSKIEHYYYISMQTMEKKGFVLLSSSQPGESNSKTVDVFALIKSQLDEINKSLINLKKLEGANDSS